MFQIKNRPESTDISPMGSTSPSPEIFKLSIDCFDEIFEYLSLKDLHSFGQTCKRMNKMAGEYFKQNYSAVSIAKTKDGFYALYFQSKNDDYRYYYSNVEDQTTLVSGFKQFIGYIMLSNVDDLEKFTFQSMKHLFMYRVQLSADQFKKIKTLLAKVESIQIRHSSVVCRQYDVDNLLSFCENVKSIHFVHVRQLGHKWLNQVYPKLEHVELIQFNLGPIVGISQFLQLNPTVRSFSTSLECFWNSRRLFIESTAQLDTLEIKGMNDNPNNHWLYIGFEAPSIQTIGDFLHELHGRGFYKKLHYCIKCIDSNDGSILASFPGLEKLCVQRFSGELLHFTNLKELAILDCSNATNMEIMANNLIRLERLYLKNSKYNDIVPFLSSSANLRKIKVFPNDEDHFNGGILKLISLNNERTEKLNHARKVTIYVPDNIFLATKWTIANGQSDFSKIEMKRTDSYAWNRHCGWDYEFGMEEFLAWNINLK